MLGSFGVVLNVLFGCLGLHYLCLGFAYFAWVLFVVVVWYDVFVLLFCLLIDLVDWRMLLFGCYCF